MQEDIHIEKESKIKFFKSPQCLIQINPLELLKEDVKCKKRTKTICTIGPKSQNKEIAEKLIGEGMDVARLNFSHGDHESQRLQMIAVQDAANTRGDSYVSILLDTKGPEIRTGNNATKDLIQLKAGQRLQITTDYSYQGTSSRIACSYQDLPSSTFVGAKILIADGSVSTKVVKIQNGIVTVQVLNDGKIGSRKNMCLPGTIVALPTIGPVDKKDIVEFGLKYKVNFIAVSFSRYKKDLDQLRKLLIQNDPQHGPFVQIISKIQNHEGVLNIDQIIEGSDGIMIARGDLGMEVPLEKVVILQKYITEKAINAGKIVITATQMLQSMQSKPRPTRAEVADVTNAVYDLTDANMTSGQTANGQFPIETVRYMRLIGQEAENTCNYKTIFENRKPYIKNKVSLGIISLSFELDCHFIFIQTEQVSLIHRLSTLRPKSYIIIFTDNQKVRGAVSADFGVYVYNIYKLNEWNNFIKILKQDFGFRQVDKLRVLTVQINKENVFSTKFQQVD